MAPQRQSPDGALRKGQRCHVAARHAACRRRQPQARPGGSRSGRLCPPRALVWKGAGGGKQRRPWVSRGVTSPSVTTTRPPAPCTLHSLLHSPHNCRDGTMDELAFDFERGLEQNVGQPVEPPPSMPASGRKNYRMARALLAASRLRRSLAPLQTVCRHWLRGLCMKGNACGFLHQFEASRMPVCRFFAKYNECKVRKQTVDGAHVASDAPSGAGLPVQALQRRHQGAATARRRSQPTPVSPAACKQDCNMYKLGFCIHGSNWHATVQSFAASLTDARCLLSAASGTSSKPLHRRRLKMRTCL